MGRSHNTVETGSDSVQFTRDAVTVQNARLVRDLLTSAGSGMFAGMVVEGHIEEGDIGMLELQSSLAKREIAIADGQELLFVEKEVSLVIDRPFKFAGHAQGIDGAGLHAHATEEAAGHIHIIFLGVSLDGLAGDFSTDDGDDSAGTGGFAEIATYAFLSPIIVPEQGQHASVVVRKSLFLVRILDGNRVVVKEMHQRGLHADSDLVEGDGLQPLHQFGGGLGATVCAGNHRWCGCRHKRSLISAGGLHRTACPLVEPALSAHRRE
jgi:hypothetical protein